MRRRRRELSPFRAGALALLAIATATYLGLSRDIPFTKPFELRAAFETASNLQPDSPVRIAGVEVGKVSKIEGLDAPGAGGETTAAVVTMKLRDRALPIRADAQLKVRPRIFLEGNFFVDLRPGTPEARELRSGEVIPMTQTSAPVQLGQVLTSLQSSTRADLRRLLAGYGDALAGRPLPGEDADQDESTKGETAGRALNDSLDDAADALRGVAIVNEATLGSERHDLSELIAGQRRVSAALASREERLKDLVTSFNRTLAATASEEASLRETIGLLPRVLERANPALDGLNAAFPPTRAFAREVLPGVRETPATIDAALPWIAQTRRLVSPAELGGLVNDLRPATGDLAAVTDQSLELLPQVDLVSRCALDVILPTGDVKIDEGALSTGVENYKELLHSLVSLSGESQNFDGNGQYTRFQPGGGDRTVSTGALPGIGSLFANAPTAPLGSRPRFPGKRPPYRRDLPCHRSRPPDLSSAQTGAGP